MTPAWGPAPSARQIVAATSAAERSAVEVVTDCLERIVACEDWLHAWAWLDPDTAMAQARAVDRHRGHLPLRGVPVGIKDIIDTADQPTSYGSPIYQGHRPESDAEVVARIRQAGGIVVGKTVTTEFALFEPGPTVNPHDPARTPGGSSSGSAAAVAAGLIPLALGTQTAGSVVRPASFCGVFGAKPTFGRLSTAGVKACAPSLDTVGVFARHAEDLVMADVVLSGSSGHAASTQSGRADPASAGTPSDAATSTFTHGRPLRLGYLRTHLWDELEPTTRTALDAAVELLAGEHTVDEVDTPASFADLIDAQQVVMATEARRSLAAEVEEHAEMLSERLRGYLGAARDGAMGYAQAGDLARDCRESTNAWLSGFDAVVTPSVLGEAPPIDTTGDPLLCRTWTLLGVPAVAVPGMLGPEGLPLGLQIVARSGSDHRLWQVAGEVARRLAA